MPSNKGPIVSRYCAVAGKIKVAGPRGSQQQRSCTPKKRAYTRARTQIQDGRGAVRVTRSSRPALDVSLIFINDGEFEFLHR